MNLNQNTCRAASDEAQHDREQAARDAQRALMRPAKVAKIFERLCNNDPFKIGPTIYDFNDVMNEIALDGEFIDLTRALMSVKNQLDSAQLIYQMRKIVAREVRAFAEGCVE